MPSPQQVEQWKKASLDAIRRIASKHDHLKAVAVTARLLGRFQVFDDLVSERRWIFDTNGEVVKSLTRRYIDRQLHNWRPGVRDL